MIVVWKVLGVLLVAAVAGGFLVTRALGDSGPTPEPGPPVVLTDPTGTAPATTLRPDGGKDGGKQHQGKPGSKPGQGEDLPGADDDDDDLYPEVEDHDDDGDDDDEGGDD